MANARQAPAQEEQQEGGWWRTILNAVLIYFAINAATALIGGKLGVQKNATDQDGSAARGPEQVPPLWPLGTEMVCSVDAQVMSGHEDLSRREHIPIT